MIRRVNFSILYRLEMLLPKKFRHYLVFAGNKIELCDKSGVDGGLINASSKWLIKNPRPLKKGNGNDYYLEVQALIQANLESG